MKKIKIIFLPGNGGDGNTSYGWFPYIKDKFEKMGIEVINPIFPDGILARKDFWLPFLESLKPDENTILVGHSSGAVAIMKYTENNKVLGSVLVAPCYTDLGLSSEKVSGYYNDAWNWIDIKKNHKWIIQFSSINDPFIPIEEARFINENLDTKYHELTEGHFMKETFSELVESVKSILE
ncbi:MAG: alpha/beta hydrolase [Candidatus Pacebacteria bacterium]|nr:alpha/beta hydrolase [Candidatus Paceibacterota bacterium]